MTNTYALDATCASSCKSCFSTCSSLDLKNTMLETKLVKNIKVTCLSRGLVYP